jgi:hypothetical protein
VGAVTLQSLRSSTCGQRADCGTLYSSRMRNYSTDLEIPCYGSPTVHLNKHKIPCAQTDQYVTCSKSSHIRLHLQSSVFHCGFPIDVLYTFLVIPMCTASHPSSVSHSPPSSAEVKNACSCTSTPPIRLHGVVLS